MIPDRQTDRRRQSSKKVDTDRQTHTHTDNRENRKKTDGQSNRQIDRDMERKPDNHRHCEYGSAFVTFLRKRLRFSDHDEQF